jgi:hypothetical protein
MSDVTVSFTLPGYNAKLLMAYYDILEDVEPEDSLLVLDELDEVMGEIVEYIMRYGAFLEGELRHQGYSNMLRDLFDRAKRIEQERESATDSPA